MAAGCPESSGRSVHDEDGTVSALLHQFRHEGLSWEDYVPRYLDEMRAEDELVPRAIGPAAAHGQGARRHHEGPGRDSDRAQAQGRQADAAGQAQGRGGGGSHGCYRGGTGPWGTSSSREVVDGVIEHAAFRRAEHDSAPGREVPTSLPPRPSTRLGPFFNSLRYYLTVRQHHFGEQCLSGEERLHAPSRAW